MTTQTNTQNDAGSETADVIPQQYQNSEKQATAEFWVGGETQIEYRLSKVEDRHEQTVYVLFKEKEVDCGSFMGHSPEVEVFQNKNQVKEFFQEREYTATHFAEPVQEMLAEFDIEVEVIEMLDPYTEMKEKLAEALETPNPPHEAVVAAVDQKYPDHYDDSREVKVVEKEDGGEQ